MDEMDRPAETPVAVAAEAAPPDGDGTDERNAETIDPGTGDPSTTAGTPARRAPRRAPRRRKKADEAPPEAAVGVVEVAQEPPPPAPATAEAALFTGETVAEADDAPPDAAGPNLRTAPLEIDEAPLDLAELEVIEAGEPIPLLLRETLPLQTQVGSNDVLVPEALEETPSPFLELSELPRGDGDLLAITPELLAEVRGVTPEEALREQAALAETQRAGRRADRPGRGGRDRDRDRDQPREEPPAPPVEVEPVLGGFVLVPEALLEAVPEDWTGDEVDDGFGDTLPPLAAPGRRGRGRGRRGRDRDRGPRPEETVARPAEAPPKAPIPAAAAPPAMGGITILGRADEEAPTPRDRDRRDREVRTEREYKELLVNVTDRETRIGVLENGRLVELHVEREERVVGNIYKGRVSNVLQGMDAAFVDIGLDRNAFLYVGDILFDDPSGRTRDGEAPARRTSRDVRISDLTKSGQEILVQVVKGPRGTKGARVSTKISIPGRYLVLMPEGDHLGVSRKVEDVRERERLRRLGEQIQPKGFGLILRTEAEGRTEAEIRADLEYLVKSWSAIVEKNRRGHAPVILHKDLGIILKTIRDLFGSDTDKLVIDSAEEYEKIVDTLSELAPELVDRVVLYDEPEPLFSKFNLEEEIEKLLRRKVWLRNGAYLLLDTTEALTTIDVNTGKFVGTSSLAETILKTNLDAVDEIARQLRLRDIGGMIVLDFIDMSSSADRHKVMRALEHAFRKDRTRIKIAHISPLGLVEMTRKRTSEAVTDVMSHTCPYCQGRGRVWSPETMAIQIERAVIQMCAKSEVEAVLISASPEVAAFLIGPEGESVEQMERLLRRPVYVRARHDFHIEKYELMPADMMEMERQMMPFHGGQVVDCQVTRLELIAPPRSAAWSDGYFVDLANGVRFQGQTTRVRLTDVRRSFALGEPIPPSTAVDRSEPI